MDYENFFADCHHYAGPNCILLAGLSNRVGSKNAYSFIHAARLIPVHASRVFGRQELSNGLAQYQSNKL